MAFDQRPLPYIEGEAEPFWQACAQGQLSLQRCADCGTWIYFPRTVCPNCLGEALRWQPVSGQGVVYSFSVVHKPAFPEMADEVPYVVALVELAEGVRMMTNVVDCPPEQVAIGMPVTVTYRKVDDQVFLPVFRPATATAEGETR